MTNTYRFALTISGGLAMGAYEAGVLAQLYRDIESINQASSTDFRLVIDAVSGASAGSITGLVLVRALGLAQSADDFEAAMRAIWVDGVDIVGFLQPPNGSENSLFTQGEIERVAALALPSVPGDNNDDVKQAIAIWMALTNLDGVPIEIEIPSAGGLPTQIHTWSYKDFDPYMVIGPNIRGVTIPTDDLANPPTDPTTWWGSFLPVRWQDAISSAVASGSFPFAFKTKQMKRDLKRNLAYQKFKDPTWPDDPICTIVDGGLLGNEPIGKAVDAVSYLEAMDSHRINDNRTHIIVEPDPTTPADIRAAFQKIADRDAPDGIPPQELIGAIISTYFNTALFSDFLNALEVNNQIDAIKALGLGANEAAVMQAVGLAHKKSIVLERVPNAIPTADRLAGDFWGDFGGFTQTNFPRL